MSGIPCQLVPRAALSDGLEQRRRSRTEAAPRSALHALAERGGQPVFVEAPDVDQRLGECDGQGRVVGPPQVTVGRQREFDVAWSWCPVTLERLPERIADCRTEQCAARLRPLCHAVIHVHLLRRMPLPTRGGGCEGSRWRPRSARRSALPSKSRARGRHPATRVAAPAERYEGVPFTDQGFEHVPALEHLQDWLTELVAA